MDPNKGYSYSEGSTGWLEPRFLYGLALVVFFDGQYQEFQISVRWLSENQNKGP